MIGGVTPIFNISEEDYELSKEFLDKLLVPLLLVKVRHINVKV